MHPLKKRLIRPTTSAATVVLIGGGHYATVKSFAQFQAVGQSHGLSVPAGTRRNGATFGVSNRSVGRCIRHTLVRYERCDEKGTEPQT